MMQALMPTWLQRNGLSPDRVKVLQLDPAVIASSLVKGQIDAAECWEGNSLPIMDKQARSAGLSIGWLPYRSFGLDMYGSGLATSDAIIAKNPEMVRKFVAATYRGYAAAAADPDRAVQIMVRRFPLLDPGITRHQLEQTLSLMHSDRPVGFIEPQRMATTIAYLQAAKALDSTVDAADIFTTKFLSFADKRTP